MRGTTVGMTIGAMPQNARHYGRDDMTKTWDPLRDSRRRGTQEPGRKSNLGHPSRRWVLWFRCGRPQAWRPELQGDGEL